MEKPEGLSWEHKKNEQGVDMAIINRQSLVDFMLYSEYIENELQRKFKEWENQRDTIEKMNTQINELKEKFLDQLGHLNKLSNLNTKIVGIIER